MAKGFKIGGRKVGTKNKLSGTTKEMITEIITKELQNLPALFEHLEPKEKAHVIIKHLPYIMSKESSEKESTNKNNLSDFYYRQNIMQKMRNPISKENKT